MKNLIILSAFLTSTVFYAQDQAANVDHIETTTTKTTSVKVNGEKIERKVKVNTKAETPITFEKQPDGTLDRKNNPTKIEREISIDNDNDPFYDETTKEVFYSYNDNNYTFTSNDTGFVINTMENEQLSKHAKALKLNNSNRYLFKSDKLTGVGYFNAEGNFVIEYYDPEKDALVTKTYLSK